jgi:paraquat-inducible protein A
MSSTNTGIMRVTALAFLIVAFFLGLVVVVQSNERSHALKHAAEMDSVGGNTSYVVKNFFETVTFGWYDGASSDLADYRAAVAHGDECGTTATVAAWLLALVTAGFVGYVWTTGKQGTAEAKQLVVRYFCYASLILFFVGVASTALSVIAFTDNAVTGQVIFKFDSKGIGTTILKLFSSGNVVLGFLILLFSIVLPLAKVGLMLFASYTSGPVHERAVKVVKAVGKWSMADVFVIAVLLALFAIDGDKLTDAKTGPGLYFFTAYCLLSMWASLWLASIEHGDEQPALRVVLADQVRIGLPAPSSPPPSPSPDAGLADQVRILDRP